MSTAATFLRSTIFNICFFGMTIILAIVALPATAMKRRHAMAVAMMWVTVIYWLERNILKLDYEVRGLEHFPAGQACLIAAKHQSSYETFKLHRILGDPAIVLKRELLRIPLWGRFLKKIDPIAIDRSNREQAMKSLLSGLQHVKEQNRPVVIFPQGTRVKWTDSTAKRPYKGGVAKMQQASNLPIIPLALNTGLFWPKMSWIKKPGTVIFEFQPPIMPGGSLGETMQKVETAVETATARLVAESHARSV